MNADRKAVVVLKDECICNAETKYVVLMPKEDSYYMKCLIVKKN